MKPIYITKSCQIKEDRLFVDGNETELDYKQAIADPTLRRRMSRIVKMGVACGLKCIEEIDKQSIDAIITATGLGCLADTEKFLDSIIVNEEKLLNPTPFIQSTFNTIGGQIALMNGIHSYNVTYVHRGLSFESALIDASMQVADGKRNVLLGAVDEITQSSADIQHRLGLDRNFALGEGANFFLLNNSSEGNSASINDIETSIGQKAENEVAEWIEAFMKRNGLSADNIFLLSGCKQASAEAIAKKTGLKANWQNEKQTDYPTFTAELLNIATSKKNISGNILIFNEYQDINRSLVLLKK